MQDSGHTPEWSGPAVERVMSNGKRVFALAFRRWLVEQASQPGASVAARLAITTIKKSSTSPAEATLIHSRQLK